MAKATKEEVELAMSIIDRSMALARRPAMVLGSLDAAHFVARGADSAEALLADVINAAKAFSAALEKAYAWKPKEVPLADVQDAISRIGGVP